MISLMLHGLVALLILTFILLLKSCNNGRTKTNDKPGNGDKRPHLPGTWNNIDSFVDAHFPEEEVRKN